MATTLFELQALLTLDRTGFDKGVSGARTSFSNLGSDLDNDADNTGSRAGNTWATAFGTAMGQTIGNFAGRAVDAIFDFATDGVKLASQMQETQNVIDVTFGASAAQVYRWGEAAETAFGMSTNAALDYAGQLGSMAIGSNYTAEQAANMSTSLVALAADFASFRNISFGEAFSKIKSGLKGEGQAIDELGIIMNVASVEQWYNAQVEGAEKMYGKLSEAEKFAVRYRYIMENASKMGIMGDFTRNRDSFANQMKLFQANMEELKTTLGESLLPVMTDIVTFFNTLFGGRTQSVEEFGATLTQSMSESYAQIQATSDSAIGLINAMIALEEQGIDTDAEQSQWNALMQQLQTSVSGVNEVLGDQATSIAGCKTALIDYINEWREGQLEMARESAMQEYYTKLEKETADVINVENQLAVARAMSANREQEWARIIGEARAHYGLGDEIDAGQVFEHLAQNAATDGYAQVWMDQLTLIDNADARIAELERQRIIEQADVTNLTNEIDTITRRMDEMDRAIGRERAGETAPAGAGGVKPDLPPINLTINIEGSAVMDGQAVGHLMMPQISAEIRRQANAQMHVR